MEQSGPPSVELLSEFDIAGTLVNVSELKRGHINRTFVGTWNVHGVMRRYVHQVVNHRVFQDIPGLMRNVELVTSAIKGASKEGGSGSGDVTLTIVPTKAGASWLRDQAGEYWRTFEFIENSVSYDVCPSGEYAFESAAILGRFQRALSTLSASSLVDTIPFFHDGARRVEALERAVSDNSGSRLEAARKEVDFALERKSFGELLVRSLNEGKVPRRPTHNDMKLNNVLFSSAGPTAVSVVDLDTCMPGTVLFDFGDLVRNTAVPCEEDEQDLSKVRVDLELYEALCRGYLREYGDVLTGTERELLPLSPRVLALVLGVRFLTDYLNGDVYFRIHRPAQNLDRARTQFAIVSAMERLEGRMRDVIERS
jgi:hypothetical protein